MKYRITFTGNRNSTVTIDQDFKNVEEAFKYAYSLDMRRQGFTDVSVEEIHPHATVIGLEVEYEDTYFKKKFTDYYFIKAENEKQARNYYNKHVKGRRFWFNCHKEEADGKCVLGRVKSTYFVGDNARYYDDATKDM